MKGWIYRYRAGFFRMFLVTVLISKYLSGKSLLIREWVVLCAILWMCVLFRVWCAGFLDDACDPTEHGRRLITSGPYSYVRNPLYFATFVMGMVYVIMSGIVYAMLVWIIYFVVLYDRIVVQYEEEFLETRFGDEYREYRKSVPRYLPLRLGRWKGGAGQFRLKEGVRNEISTFVETAGLSFGFLLA